MSVDPLAEKYPGLSPYNYCANNPLKNVDIDGRDFYAILAPSGAHGYGHIAQVIGDEKTGWTYISKNGTDKNKNGVFIPNVFGFSAVGQLFGKGMSFPKFMEWVNSLRKVRGQSTYVFAVKIATKDKEQDERMINEALATASDPYVLSSQDCIGNVSGTLDSEGFDGGSEDDKLMQIPNRNFFNILKRNHGQLMGLSNYAEDDATDEWVKRVQDEMRKKEQQQ